jgi:DNA-binding MarR family transcriptional regulator
MTVSLLSDNEMALWLRFRFTGEETSLRVSRELSNLTGITGGQFGIMNNLARQKAGELRQQRLADLMRWDRTRLSHQLTRMAQRGLVRRAKIVPKETIVVLTELGRSELARIKPVLAQAVRKHFFARLTSAQRLAIDELAVALRDSPDIL